MPNGDLLASQSDALYACVKSLGLAQIQRHLFICADATNPKCCDKAATLVAWDYLKQRLKQLQLDQPTQGASHLHLPHQGQLSARLSAGSDPGGLS